MTRPPYVAKGLIRGVLFDLDGTLLDTLEDIADAANRVLAAHGFPRHETDAYRRFVGDGLRELVVRILPDAHRDEVTVNACLAAFREDYGHAWNIATRPYPGIPEVLDALAARGIALAVLSNKPDDLTVRCVTELLPGWRFGAVLGQREGIPRKPDPTAALEIARRLGFPPGDFLFVGDSPVDQHTARSAGMTPVGVSWGFRSPEELANAGAAVILRQPGDLIDLMDRS